MHLTTTDPAAHLTETLNGELDNLQVSRIDPADATEQYRTRVLTTKGKNLDDRGRANLAEDLRSPCTEEVAVFQAFSRVIHESSRKIRRRRHRPRPVTPCCSLNATGSYHREIARQMGENTNFTTPLMRLQDPNATKVLLVRPSPKPHPSLEAAGLQADLQRAGIEPWAWVVNNSLVAAEPTSPLLQQRTAGEIAEIGSITSQYSQPNRHRPDARRKNPSAQMH